MKRLIASVFTDKFSFEQVLDDFVGKYAFYEVKLPTHKVSKQEFMDDFFKQKVTLWKSFQDYNNDYPQLYDEVMKYSDDLYNRFLKTIKLDVDYKAIIKKIQEEYNFLYEYYDKVAGYDEALDEGEAILKNPDNKEFIQNLIQIRQDIFSSDREIAALAFALDDLNMLGGYGQIIF